METALGGFWVAERNVVKFVARKRGLYWGPSDSVEAFGFQMENSASDNQVLVGLVVHADDMYTCFRRNCKD